MAIGDFKPQGNDDEDCEILEEWTSKPLAMNPGVSRDSGIPGNSGENSRNSGPSAGDF
jgi:hypothetical protein